MPPLGDFQLETQAQSLFIGWARHFLTQDQQLGYTGVEKARAIVLRNDIHGMQSIILAGIIDAEGKDFFAEFKTSTPRDMKTWKRTWLMSPQALTYGLLTGGKQKFLVRKAFKTTTPQYDHEWFQFSPDDLEMWRSQVLTIADEIFSYRLSGLQPWPLNLTHGCFAYGPNYPCPFWQDGCSKNKFAETVTSKRLNFPEFHGENLAILEDAIKSCSNTPIVLTSTRINTWMRCREMYRQMQSASFPPSEAMLLGSRFHEIVANYNRKFIAQGENK